jgi:ribosomal protein S18 acetylase RimI-like enzyme
LAISESRVSIRKAREGEVAAVARVLRQSFREYRSSYTAAAYAATTPTAGEVRARLREGPTWIASLDGAVVGTVSAVLRAPFVYIRSMAVLPRARGQRIGERLLQRVEAFARARRGRRLSLSTTPFLGRAIRLYEKQGFRASDEGPDELFGTRLFTMTKVLRTRR